MADPTVEQRDAYQRMVDVLTRFDLGDLAQWAWDQSIQDRSLESMQIDLYDQPAFKQRFWVIEARRQAGLPPVSPADVLNYEDTWSQMARAAGLPDGFATRDVAQKQMAANRSLVEAKARLDEGFVTVHNSPQSVRDAWGSFFGTQGDAAMAAFMIDEELALPELERMVLSAQTAGAGAEHGFSLQQSMADRMARMGIDYAHAQSGFSQLDQQRHLLDQTITETNPLTAETAIEAQFGMSGTAAEDVRRKAEERKAEYSGTAGAIDSQQGIIGLGGARQT